MKQTHQIGTINEKEKIREGGEIGTINEKEKIREGGERGREAVKEWDGVSLEKNTSLVQIHYSFTDTNKFKEEKIKTVSLF